MALSYESFGRVNQKQRTRQALVLAAAEFVERGETPTVEQVAEAALVAKSTAYRYFPTQEMLLATAHLEIVNRPGLAAVFAASSGPGSAEERLDAVIRADHALVTAHEAAYRAFLRSTLAPRTDDTPRRPGNRLRYLGGALEPVRERLGEERLARLVVALAMSVGIESLIALQDIGGLSANEAQEVKRWVAATLLRGSLDEVDRESAAQG